MEKPEINLEKIQLLIDKLTSQVSDHSAIEHLLPTAQMLVAELQEAQITAKPRASVSVVMPSGTLRLRQADTEMEGQQGPVSVEETLPQPIEEAPEAVRRSFSLQPPTTITEQPPEQTMDTQSYLPVSDVTPITTISAHTPQTDIPAREEEDFPVSDTVPAAHDVVQPAAAGEPAGAADDPLHPSFPTSIPADTPEIQNENTSAEPEAAPLAPASYAPSPSATSGIDSDRQPEPVPEVSDNSSHLPIPDNYPDFQEQERDKQKHLDFIHENFSSWSDYGRVSEVPTLVQHRPLQSGDHEKDLNEHFREDREEWAQTLQSTPIDNLAGAIGINDRYLFISELFRGDESMYERSILTLNKFNDYSQAHAWSERELRLKLGWDIDNPITQQFEQLVKRRFMAKTAR